MKILIADDDPIFRTSLEFSLADWGYEVTACAEGETAWQLLQQNAAPKMAILDWTMPGLSGPEICRRTRQLPTPQPPYLLLLTARSNQQDLVAGLQSGANDYLTKPFDPEELRARLQIARHVIELEEKLAQRVLELETALAQVKRLQGLLPICMYCKKICKDKDYWQEVERYFMEQADARFTHGICPECFQREMSNFFADNSFSI